MMTATEINKNAEILVNVIRLIEKYRSIENAPKPKGFSFIKEISRPDLANHLCGHWDAKNRDFGAFYLNLDYKLQFSILNFWAIAHFSDGEYVKMVEEDPRGMLFVEPTGFLAIARKVLLFFNNHGINQDPAGDGTITLRQLPNDRFRYGNSANWGSYILCLGFSERVRVLSQILNRCDS